MIVYWDGSRLLPLELNPRAAFLFLAEKFNWKNRLS